MNFFCSTAGERQHKINVGKKKNDVSCCMLLLYCSFPLFAYYLLFPSLWLLSALSLSLDSEARVITAEQSEPAASGLITNAIPGEEERKVLKRPSKILVPSQPSSGKDIIPKNACTFKTLKIQVNTSQHHHCNNNEKTTKKQQLCEQQKGFRRIPFRFMCHSFTELIHSLSSLTHFH